MTGVRRRKGLLDRDRDDFSHSGGGLLTGSGLRDRVVCEQSQADRRQHKHRSSAMGIHGRRPSAIDQSRPDIGRKNGVPGTA